MPLVLCSCGLARHAYRVAGQTIYKCEHCDRPCSASAGNCHLCAKLSKAR
jgi:hypothetical protein